MTKRQDEMKSGLVAIVDQALSVEWHELQLLDREEIVDEIISELNKYMMDSLRIASSVCPQCQELTCDGPPRCLNPDGRETEAQATVRMATQPQG